MPEITNLDHLQDKFQLNGGAYSYYCERCRRHTLHYKRVVRGFAVYDCKECGEPDTRERKVR